MPNASRIYVGIRRDATRERFNASGNPNTSTNYVSIIGPFRTVGAADLAVLYGPTRTLQSVADYERINRRNPDLALVA